MKWLVLAALAAASCKAPEPQDPHLWKWDSPDATCIVAESPDYGLALSCWPKIGGSRT